MSAEVSFTKRAAQELSRCFNGLTVGRTGSTKSTASTSGVASSKAAAASSSSNANASAGGAIAGSGAIGATSGAPFASSSTFEPQPGPSSNFVADNEWPTESTHLLVSNPSQASSSSSSSSAVPAYNSASSSASSNVPFPSGNIQQQQYTQSSSSSIPSSSSQQQASSSIPNPSQKRGYKENDPSPSSSNVNQRAGTDLKPLVPQNKITIISPSPQCTNSSASSSVSTNPFGNSISEKSMYNNPNLISQNNHNPSHPQHAAAAFYQQQQQQAQIHNQNPPPFIHTRPLMRRSSGGNGPMIGPPHPPQRPAPPPKTMYARRKNYLLGLAVPRTVADLWLNESFLRRHFLPKFTAKERCVLAQVCRTWRDLIYDDPNCWKHLLPVIYCNQLRRETLNQTILSNTLSNSSEMSSIPLGSIDNLRQNNNRGFSTITTTDNYQDQDGNDGRGKDSDDSSDYMSSVSKITPVDTIRLLLYSSLDRRGFDSICLFGASDADIIDFASRISPLVLKRFNHGVLRCSSCSDKGLEIFLAALSQSITKLELSGCNEISDAGLWTSIVPRLQSLAIMDCINVADETVAAVTQMLPHLEEFHIQAYHVTDGALNYFAASFARENLRVLKLEHCWEITNQGVVSIAQGLPNLVSLSMAGCSKITDDAIEVLAEQLRHLKRLDLSWLTRITDSSLEYIACDLSETLVELVLDRCLHVTDIGLGYIATMSKLHTLSLRWCPQLRDFGLQTLWSMRSLRVLSLAGCRQLTATGMSGLAQMQQLQELELTNCPAATPDLINYLRQSLPYSCTIIV